MLPVRLRSKGEGEVVSVHSGTIGGDVGGRYVSLPVVVVHCDGCEATTFEPGILDADAAHDLCPDCVENAQRTEASR